MSNQSKVYFTTDLESEKQYITNKEIEKISTDSNLINKYLLAMLNPKSSKDVTIPDLNSSPTIPKSLLYLKTITAVADNSSFMIVFTPYNRRDQFRFYAYDAASAKYTFVENILPEEQLSSNFSKVRPVTGAFDFYSDTISSTNFVLGGTVNAIQCLDMPQLTNLTSQTLMSFKRNPTSAILNVKLADGITAVAEPTNDMALLPYLTNAVVNSEVILKATSFHNMRTITLSGAETEFFVFPDPPINLWGKFTVHAECPLFWPSGYTLSTYFLCASGYKMVNGVRTLVTEKRGQTRTTDATFPTGFTMIGEFDTDFEVERVYMSAIGAAVTAQMGLSFTIESQDYYSNNSRSPCTIMICEGIGKSQTLKFSAIMHYEAQPDFNLTKNMSTNFEKTIENPLNIKIVQMMFGNKELFGFKSIYSMPEFNEMVKSGHFLKLAMNKTSRFFASSDFIDTVKSLGKQALPYVSSLLSAYNPMLGPISNTLGKIAFGSTKNIMYAGSYSGETFPDEFPLPELKQKNLMKKKFEELAKQKAVLKAESLMIEKQLKEFEKKEEEETIENENKDVLPKKFFSSRKEQKNINSEDHNKLYASSDDDVFKFEIQDLKNLKEISEENIKAPESQPSDLEKKEIKTKMFAASMEEVPIDLSEIKTKGNKVMFASSYIQGLSEDDNNTIRDAFIKGVLSKCSYKRVLKNAQNNSLSHIKDVSKIIAFKQLGKYFASSNEVLLDFEGEAIKPNWSSGQFGNIDPFRVNEPQVNLINPQMNRSNIQTLFNPPLESVENIQDDNFMDITQQAKRKMLQAEDLEEKLVSGIQKAKQTNKVLKSPLLFVNIQVAPIEFEPLKGEYLKEIAGDQFPEPKGTDAFTTMNSIGGAPFGQSLGILVGTDGGGNITKVYYSQNYLVQTKNPTEAYIVTGTVGFKGNYIKRKYLIVAPQSFNMNYIHYIFKVLSFLKKSELAVHCVGISLSPQELEGESLFLAIYCALLGLPSNNKFVYTGVVVMPQDPFGTPLVTPVTMIENKLSEVIKNQKILVRPSMIESTFIETLTGLDLSTLNFTKKFTNIEIDNVNSLTLLAMVENSIAPSKKVVGLPQQFTSSGPIQTIIQVAGGKTEKYETSEEEAEELLYANQDKYASYVLSFDKFINKSPSRARAVLEGFMKAYYQEKAVVKTSKSAAPISVTDPFKTVNKLVLAYKDPKTVTMKIKDQFEVDPYSYSLLMFTLKKYFLKGSSIVSFSGSQLQELNERGERPTLEVIEDAMEKIEDDKARESLRSSKNLKKQEIIKNKEELKKKGPPKIKSKVKPLILPKEFENIFSK